MDTKENRKETKRRFQLWIKPSTLKLAEKRYSDDNCKSISEFIEKAVIFYAGYLNSEDNRKYLPNTIASTMRGISDKSDNRIGRMLFKIALNNQL